MLDLEILTHFFHHLIVQVGRIVIDNLPRQPVPADYLFLDEPNHLAPCHTSVWGRFNPFGEVVNGDQDKEMFVWSLGSIAPITSIPHIEKGHGAANMFKGTGGALKLSTNAWHLWHFLTWIQYPAFRIFRSMACPLACVPKDPSCTSTSICSASLASSHWSNTISWFCLYRIPSLKKKPAANLRNVLFSKYHGLPSYSSSIK